MAKQTTVRLADDLADDAEAVARVRGDRVNRLIIDALAAEIERVRADGSDGGVVREGSGVVGRPIPIDIDIADTERA